MDFKERAKQIKNDIPAVFLALKHKDTPFLAKFLSFITVAYALSPVDLIPDFIPVLGYLDDLLILPLLITCTIKLIPPEVFEECRIKSKDMWKNGKPKKWYFAIPIVLFWIVVGFLIIKGIVGGVKGRK